MSTNWKQFDFYRKIPKELTETSKHGVALSLFATVFMLVLFVSELWSYLSPSMETAVVPCRFVSLDIVDVLGTREHNVTKDIGFWSIDSTGAIQQFQGKNLEEDELEHDEHHDMEELLSNGAHAVELTAENFDEWVRQHDFTFVQFHVPWCKFCRKMLPVWEALAEEVEKLRFPVSVVQMDCMQNEDFCQRHDVRKYPDFRLFKRSELIVPSYKADRTVESFVEFLRGEISLSEQLIRLPATERRERQAELKSRRVEHRGCMIAGHLAVNNVEGYFQVEAYSRHHSMNPKLSDLSHVVNHLSFGRFLSRNARRRVQDLSPLVFSVKSMAPMDTMVFKSNALHEAYHHYLKVVPTYVEIGSRYRGDSAIVAYQLVRSSQVMQYDEEDTPDARFSYSISPMAVKISENRKKLYEFITSICAVIGGTFTVVGLLSGVLTNVFKKKD